MQSLDRNLLKKIAQLSKLECSEDELDALVHHLQMIVKHAESLDEINTDDVAPCHIVLENFNTIPREDRAESSLDRETFLANSPDHVGGMIRVPPVLKS